MKRTTRPVKVNEDYKPETDGPMTHIFCKFCGKLNSLHNNPNAVSCENCRIIFAARPVKDTWAPMPAKQWRQGYIYYTVFEENTGAIVNRLSKFDVYATEQSAPSVALKQLLRPANFKAITGLKLHHVWG